MSSSPRLSLSYLVAGQAQKEITHNDALNDLDSLAQISVIDMATATPPGSPAEGDSYIIASGASGAWTGHAGKIASYYSGWRIKTPHEGWVAWVQSLDRLYVHDGTSWVLPSLSIAASGYLNFGTTAGTGGYGVRDNGGSIEYKNSGGSWAALSSGGGGGGSPTGSAGGDLSSTYPNPTVAKINGATLGTTTATSGNVLIGSGTAWATQAVSGDITINSSGVTAIGSGKVTNTMLAGSIAYSKLVLTGAILNADLAGSIALSKVSTTGTADNTTYLRGDGAWVTAPASAPNGSAGGDLSSTYPNPTVAKINGATLGTTTATSGNVLIGSGTAWATQAMSGDVTINSSGVTAIGSSKVTNAMLAGSIAYNKLALTGAILNADLAGSIAYSKLSLTGAILNADLAGSIALSKLSATGTADNTTYLRGDGTWTTPSGGGGSGTVNSGTSGQLTYYASTGTAVSGNANLTVSSGALTVGVAGTQAGTLKLSGATSGTTTLAVSAAASGTLTLPSATDTLIGKATPDTLTNKTFDTAGSGNAFKLNGTTLATVPQFQSALMMQMLPQGRLTLSSGNPVMTADATAQGTIYYAPHNGAFVPLYDGTQVGLKQFTSSTTDATGLSLALDSSTGDTGYHQSGKNFDLFVVNDSGTMRLGTGPAWSSDTARGTGAGTTELQRFMGLWTNKNSMTLRFGSSSGNTINVAANQGTYVGSFRATANGQTGMALKPSAASGGTNNFLALYNAYNRVAVNAQCADSTVNYTGYTTTSARAANASNANRISFIDGLQQSPITARYFSTINSASYNPVTIGVGLDTTSTMAGVAAYYQLALMQTVMGSDIYNPQLGFHYVQALETGQSGVTWYGNGQQGLQVTLEM